MTPCNPFKRLAASNFTTTGTTNSTADSTTAPSGTNVIDLSGGGANPVSFDLLQMIFFGVGAGSNTFTVNLAAITPIVSVDGTVTSYVEMPLADVTCTLGTRAGVASGAVVANELYAGTLSVALPTSGVDESAISPANNRTATLQLDPRGARYLKAYFDKGSATSVNLAYRGL